MDGKIVYLDKQAKVIHETACISDELNNGKETHMIKEIYDKDGNAQGAATRINKNDKNKWHLEKEDQSRFQARHDDRTVWVGIRYEGKNNQYVYLEVRQDNDVIMERIGAFDFKGDKDRKYNTQLCPSSAV